MRESRSGEVAEQPITCAAETADCNCPDACERDHGND